MRRSKPWRRNDSREEGPEVQRLNQCGLVKGVHSSEGPGKDLIPGLWKSHLLSQEGSECQPSPAHPATPNSWPLDAAPVFCLLPLREFCLGKCHMTRGQQDLEAREGSSSLQGDGAGVSLKLGPGAETVRRVGRTRRKGCAGSIP